MDTQLDSPMVLFYINSLFYSSFSFKIHVDFTKKMFSFIIGPDTWAANFGNYCNGSAQSPIDIPYDGVVKRRDWLPFQLLNYEIDPYKMYIANNGHTAVVTFTPRNCKKIPTVVQGNLPGSTLLSCKKNYQNFKNGINSFFLRSF